MVKSSVTTLSHPLIVESVSTYVPVVVYTLPFHVIESQSVIESLKITELFMVRYSGIKLSQPLTEPE